jgi:hypothetical protein
MLGRGLICRPPRHSDIRPVHADSRGRAPVRRYQLWYRNAAAGCSTAAFNLTNGWEISWAL